MRLHSPHSNGLSTTGFGHRTSDLSYLVPMLFYLPSVFRFWINASSHTHSVCGLGTTGLASLSLLPHLKRVRTPPPSQGFLRTQCHISIITFLALAHPDGQKDPRIPFLP